jgi:hypothetical protein
VLSRSRGEIAHLLMDGAEVGARVDVAGVDLDRGRVGLDSFGMGAGNEEGAAEVVVGGGVGGGEGDDLAVQFDGFTVVFAGAVKGAEVEVRCGKVWALCCGSDVASLRGIIAALLLMRNSDCTVASDGKTRVFT